MKKLEIPKTVTLPWLFHHVEWSYWISLIGLLIGIFVLGVNAGQYEFIRNIFSVSQPNIDIITKNDDLKYVDEQIKYFNSKFGHFRFDNYNLDRQSNEFIMARGEFFRIIGLIKGRNLLSYYSEFIELKDFLMYNKLYNNTEFPFLY